MHTVAQARRFLSSTLHSWGAEEYDFTGGQVVSELATNAVLHGRTDFTLRMSLDTDGLLVEVSDDSPRPPEPRTYSLESVTGRGLSMVEALSAGWGVLHGRRGKTVWARPCKDDDVLGGRDEDSDPLSAFLEEDDEDGTVGGAFGGGVVVRSRAAEVRAA
jgi:hypothetical protein